MNESQLRFEILKYAEDFRAKDVNGKELSFIEKVNMISRYVMDGAFFKIPEKPNENSDRPYLVSEWERSNLRADENVVYDDCVLYMDSVFVGVFKTKADRDKVINYLSNHLDKDRSHFSYGNALNFEDWFLKKYQ